ncbi:hypothetical protein ENSA5_15230 [Enhygromyxa salina]|uniref:Uncharacterized protein n=1 Tax=Enhygromyxa salina TaxID=215803 RepID=A0A2S9YEH8_9BACT|nr:hypothetical protein [Enhygromyxa salina]PRQ03493.1 hypothetical protein ENSA5_15230 [Enhygromyxa salina]
MTKPGDVVESALSWVSGGPVVNAIKLAAKWGQEIIAEENSRQQNADYELILAEIANCAEHRDRVQEFEWYQQRLRDPHVSEKILGTFRSMQRAQSRSARVSAAKLLGKYLGSGKISDHLFRSLGRFLEMANDDEVRCAIEISQIVRSHKEAGLELSATAKGVRLRSQAKLSPDAIPMTSPPAIVRQTMVQLKQVGLGLEAASGLNSISSPGTILFTEDLISSAATMGAYLVADPLVEERILHWVAEQPETWTRTIDLRDWLDQQIPGGIRPSELDSALRKLSQEKMIAIKIEDMLSYIRTISPDTNEAS